MHYGYKRIFSHLQVLHFQHACQWTIVFVTSRQSLVRQTTLWRTRMLWKCKCSFHLHFKGIFLILKAYRKRVFEVKVYLCVQSKIMWLVCSSCSAGYHLCCNNISVCLSSCLWSLHNATCLNCSFTSLDWDVWWSSGCYLCDKHVLFSYHSDW